MTQLTEERFKEILKQELVPLATKQELVPLATKQELVPLATKKDIREGVEELARMTSAGFGRTEERFDEIELRLDVTAQIKAFERKFRKLEEALHITL